MSPVPISFLSDYGTGDEFVGVVHGVIARIDPDLRVIDITHGIPPGDVRAGALALVRSIQYLPDGVVLAVVDPGVGGPRRAIAASTRRGCFVGPDNGLLAPAVAMVGGADRFVELTEAAFRLPRQGHTFDGRDVFAPAAAVLASGEAEMGDLGPDVDPASVTPLLLPLVEIDGGVARGEVWWVDSFGNAQTNVSPADLHGLGLAPGDTVEVRVAARTYEMPWRESFTEGGDDGGGIVLVDSSGMIALAVPNGRADESLGLRDGLSIGFTTPTATG